jgi:hypothetical protein
VREWVERRSTTQPSLTRRSAPASPWQGEASLCCFVANSRQRSVRSLHQANSTARQCRGDPVGRPLGGVRTYGRRVGSPWGRGARWCQGDAPRRPYNFLRAAVRGRRNMLPLRLQGDAPRRPYTIGKRACGGDERARRRPASTTGALPDRTRGGSRTAPTGTLRSNPWCHGPGACAFCPHPHPPWCKRGDARPRACDDFRARHRRALRGNPLQLDAAAASNSTTVTPAPPSCGPAS